MIGKKDNTFLQFQNYFKLMNIFSGGLQYMGFSCLIIKFLFQTILKSSKFVYVRTCALGRVILKLNNKNQKLFYCSDHYYVKFNSKKLLLFDRSPKMTGKLVKITFLFIKENIRKYKGNHPRILKRVFIF